MTAARRRHQVPLYILGSSLFGLESAAALGLPYAFASHFAPDALEAAVALYRRDFQPSEQLAEPYVIAGAGVIAADAHRGRGAPAAGTDPAGPRPDVPGPWPDADRRGRRGAAGRSRRRAGGPHAALHRRRHRRPGAGMAGPVRRPRRRRRAHPGVVGGRAGGVRCIPWAGRAEP
ncbi:MAG: hypothetical protein R2719_04125 [Micropruina sp.]